MARCFTPTSRGSGFVWFAGGLGLLWCYCPFLGGLGGASFLDLAPSGIQGLCANRSYRLEGAGASWDLAVMTGM